MSDNRPDVTVYVTVLVNSPLSLKVEDENGEEKWVPHSQICAKSKINGDSDRGDEGELTIPFWLAKDRGWAFDS